MPTPSEPVPLSERTCVPCEGGVPQIDRAQASGLLESLNEWNLDASAKMISKKINAKTFMGAIELVTQIAQLSEAEQHHPDLHITGYRHLTIELTTHAIGGLSENDFILASKIDELLT